MPSTEETYLIEVMPETRSLLARDVDLLVSRIKHNLRLSTTLKARSSVIVRNRTLPYRIPSRSWTDPNCQGCGMRNCHEHRHRAKRARDDDDDSYELLQELLREGGLIKEAVKRLQANIDELEHSAEEDEDEEEDDDDVEEEEEEDDVVDERPAIYRRKPYFYDSEDEPLPPVFQSLEL